MGFDWADGTWMTGPLIPDISAEPLIGPAFDCVGVRISDRSKHTHTALGLSQ